MNYADIKDVDIQDGIGVRTALYVSGCTIHCKGCHNKVAWDFNYGLTFDEAAKNRIFNNLSNSYIEGLSILGGEPMHPKNIEGTTKLAKAFKEKFPNKNLWAWSGFLFDQDLKDKEVLNYLDTLVDGQYVDELRDPTLKWKGSSNQRVINVQESLRSNNLVLVD